MCGTDRTSREDRLTVPHVATCNTRTNVELCGRPGRAHGLEATTAHRPRLRAAGECSINGSWVCASVAAAAATAATARTAAATRAATAAAGTTAAARRAILRLIDSQRASLHRIAVQALNGA